MSNIRRMMMAASAVGDSIAWDILNAQYIDAFDCTSQDGNPTSVYFKPDGLKMYVCGSSNARIFQYSLSPAWDVSTASYDNKSDNVSAQMSTPAGLAMSLDGTKMYACKSTTAYQYTLSTPWDMSTSSYASKSLALGGSDAQGLTFNYDGSVLYVTAAGASYKNIRQYDLGTAWDLATASFDDAFAPAQQTAPTDCAFNPEGTILYTVGYAPDGFHQFTLSTPWDVTSASYVSYFDTTPSSEAFPKGIFWKDNGRSIFLSGPDENSVHQFDLVK